MERKRAVEFLDRLIKQSRVDAILITDLANVWYLSGFRGSEGAILFSKKGRWFFSDFRYRDQAEEEVSGFKVKIFKNKFKEIQRLLHRLGVRNLGFEASGLSCQLFRAFKKEMKGIRLKVLKKSLAEIRARKDPDEIRWISNAAKLAEKGLSTALKSFRAGITELDFAAELEYQIRKAGSGWMPFETIVASGPRGAFPHAKATGKKIKKGELVVIDFGAAFNGYGADLTVTVAAGDPGRKARELYQIVSTAQKQAIAGLEPGKLCRDIDRLARGYIRRRGYGRYFGHGLGHGLGLAVHEEPAINSKSETVLEPGMVFTIEPGIYLPGQFGVRIEDDLVLNNEKKPLLFSRSNQPLRVLE